MDTNTDTNTDIPKTIFKPIPKIHNFIDINNINNIKKLLKKDEEVIIKYLENIIYTSKLSNNTQETIQNIFDTINATIITS